MQSSLVSGDPPIDEDPDGDGYSGQFSRPGEEFYTTAEEFENKTNPHDPDTDGDLMWDGWEIRWNFNASDASDADLDSDGDGATNVEEFYADTNPRDVDLDQDGIPDIWEDLHGLNSSDPDDAALDYDSDGLTNLQEFLNRTLPFNPDTDGDGMWDGWEVWNNLNPRDFTDAAPDFDHGGVSNIGEFNNDTDPWDPTDDYGNAGGGNGGSGIPTGDGVPPDTGRTDNEVTLINVFDPPLGALKRWQVLDGLGSNYLMYLLDDTKTPLPVTTGDFDHIFYGALNVTLLEGTYFRIPNPAPDSALLDYYFNQVSLQFFKDPADGYYVLPPDDGNPDVLSWYNDTLYFTFGTDGDYFTLDIPPTMTIADEPSDLLPGISSNVRLSVDWFLDNADDPGVRNLKGETNLDLIVGNLTSYFSNFTEGNGDVPDPAGNQDIYQAIAINKIGACRHRSFAFFVTANSMGVPTRYVSNEAHAFVEVYIPNGSYSDSNWHRIDLGGTGTTDPGEPRPPDPPGVNETIVQLGPIPFYLYMGEPFTITGNITTLNGTTLPHHPFVIRANQTLVGSGSSDSNGSFSFEIILMDVRLGPGYLIIQTFPYNGYAANLSNNRSFELYTHVLLHQSYPSSIGRGLRLYTAGFLSSMNGTVLPNVGMTLYWDSSSMHARTTNDQGDYNLSFLISGSETPGIHNLSIHASGDLDYILSKSIDRPVNVTVARVILEAKVVPESQDASANVWVTGRITDGAGSNISERGNLMVILHGNELVNGTLSDYTDSEGKAFNVTVRIPETLNRGDYILHIQYVPNPGEDIPGASVNLDIHVDKITTYVYLYPGIIEIGAWYTINGSLYSGSGIYVPGEIALYWDGGFLATLSVDESGDFSYNAITRQGPGAVEIRAQYNGSEMFTSSFAVVNYSIYSNTYFSLFVDPAEGWITRNQNIRIIGDLQDDNSEDVQGMYVYLYVTDSLGKENLIDEKITDSSGFRFVYFLSPDYIPGPLTFEVLFRPTGYYRGSSQELLYTVHAFTNVAITNVTNPVRAGTNLSLEGSLMDDMGHYIGFPLTVSFIGEMHSPFMDDGNFSWNFTVPIIQDSGDYELLVSFQEMSYYESSFHSVDITIFHLTNITPSPRNLTRGELERFQGVIRDELGNGVEGLHLDIYLRNKFLQWTLTDENGNYDLNILLNSTLSLGEADVRIQFNGTSYYSQSNSSYSTYIFASTHLVLLETPYVTRDLIFLSGTLFDNMNTALSNMSITLEFNDESIDIITNATGNFSQQYIDPIVLGFHTLTASFAGKGYYLPSEQYITIRVVSLLNINLTYRNEPVAGQGFVLAGTVLDDRDFNATTELNITLSSPRDTVSKNHMVLSGQFNTTWTLDPSMEPGWYVLYLNNSSPYPSTNYLPSSYFTDVYLKRATYINISIPNAVRDKQVTLTGNVMDVAHNPVRFELVHLQFDNLNLKRYTDENGNFSFTFLVPEDASAGPHLITVSFEGNTTLLPSILMDTLWVYVPTSVLMAEKRVHWSIINITGTVEDNQLQNVRGIVDIYFDGRSIGSVYADYQGFKLTYPFRAIGDFEIRAVFRPDDFYLGSESTTTYHLFSYLIIDYNITSSLTGQIPAEFDLENPVLAGESFKFTLNVSSDLGLLPAIFGLNRIFDNDVNTTTVPDSNTSFYVRPWLRPTEKHNITIDYEIVDPYFDLYPNPYQIVVNVLHPSELHVSHGQGDGILTIAGYVKDGYVRNDNPQYKRHVTLGEINVSRNGNYLDMDLESGEFLYSSDVSDRWGPEVYTFIYPANKYYLGSNLTISIYIKAFTMLTLRVPDSLREDESFTGTVHLTYLTGDPVEAAVILLEMNGDEITVITGSDGKRKFHAVMDANHSVVMTATFEGNDYFYPSQDEKGIDFDSGKDQGLTLSSFFTSRALIAYIILGTAGFYFWRRKQIKYLMSLVHDTALRLEGGESPKSVIIIAYNLMCRHLRRFSLIRKRYETVGEFKGNTQEQMRLSEDGIGNLTYMMEFADYSLDESKEAHKERAVRSLRNVERELAGLGVRGRRR